MAIYKILIIFKYIEKFIIGFYTNIWFFLFFSSFYVKVFLCQWWINIPGKTFLGDLNKKFSKINLFMWKKAVLHQNTPMHCKARHVLVDLCSTNQGNGSEKNICGRSLSNKSQKLENLGTIGWSNAGNNLKASII